MRQCQGGEPGLEEVAARGLGEGELGGGVDRAEVVVHVRPIIEAERAQIGTVGPSQADHRAEPEVEGVHAASLRERSALLKGSEAW